MTLKKVMPKQVTEATKVPANMQSPYLGPGYKDVGHKENSTVVSATACIWTTTQNTISMGGKRFLFKT